MSWFVTALVWLVSRAAVLWLFFGRESWVTGDVAYFAGSLAAVPDVGLGSTLVEYPLPGVVLVAFPWLLAEWAGYPGAYALVVMVFALVTDGLFTGLLEHFGHRRRSALWVWLLAVPLLGATAYARFDLVPGILAAVGLLLLSTHPRIAAAAGAVATGLKFWPALLLPALAARSQGRRQVVVVVGLVGTALAGASLLTAGWDRLISPLTWQGERGLQIESVLASPAMLGWALSPAGFEVAFSDYNAVEIAGPGTDSLLAVSEVATLALMAALVLLWVRTWRHGSAVSLDAVTWTCLAAVTGFLVTSKVLSPQYLLWLLPLAAAGLAASDTARGGAALRRWAVGLLVATGATHLIFPVFYLGLSSHQPWSVWVVLLLVARNVILVWLFVRAATEAWLAVSAASSSTASRRGRRRAASAPSGGAMPTPTSERAEPPR